MGDGTQSDVLAAFAQDFPTLHRKLSLYFRQNGSRDPEDRAAEALARLHSRLKKGTPLTSTLAGFAFGIARNVLLEDYKHREKSSLNEAITETADDTHQRVQMHVLAEECLRLLSPAEEQLLRGYFWGDRKKLAEELGVTLNSLRIRACRAIKHVREQLGGADA